MARYRLYRTDYPDSCRIEPVDGLTLVFHRPSGTTHFLDAPVPDMLTLLAEQSATAEDLAERLCIRLGLELDDEAREVVSRRLIELTAAGLVWTERCTA
ncbi:HPr-rel-A system PqqD family peptide chaperone [Rhizorhabdus sp. FW153]|uniref:HPr-rel-A system PqqD family peptide chaperone n=1 Tax=Rhizorhabdus sp. FW153 TaxID=3400216 RepID=UPI003CE8A653